MLGLLLIRRVKTPSIDAIGACLGSFFIELISFTHDVSSVSVALDNTCFYESLPPLLYGIHRSEHCMQIGLGRLSKYFCLLFYSIILNALAYSSFTVTYLCLQKKMKDVVKTTQIITQINTIQ